MNYRGRQRIRGWAPLLLPVLLWRALIPIGFMPMIGLDHSIQLVVCDTYAPLPAQLMDMSMSMDGDMEMAHSSGSGNGGAPVHQNHGGCPYGSGPALGALPTLAVAPVIADTPAALTFSSPDLRVFPNPSPAHAARAPPV